MNSTTCPSAFAAAPLLFGWLDFTVFGTMLVASALVGVYFGFYKKQNTKVAYLMGGKSMSSFPVAISLVACHISGITVMGVPSETYTYGIIYVLVCFSCIFVATVMNYVYLPVFFELQLTSTYEYLEMRFSRSVRVMASVLYTITVLLYMPIVVYVPALAFSQVSGVSVHLITPVVCVICIFYTMLGGFRAVVWSDFIQTFIMVGSCVAVLVLGVQHVGGWGVVMQRSRDGGRINILEMDPSPTTRNTFWTVLLGTIVLWSAAMTNQMTVQKCLALPTLRQAAPLDPSPLARSTVWTVLIGSTILRISNMVSQGSLQKFLSVPKKSNATQVLCFYCVGIITMKILTVLTGLIIYAAYHDCDPIKTQAVKRADQLLAYFVMDKAGSIPGLPGIFVAGVFSASMRGNEEESRSSFIMKTIVLVVGSVCVLLVFVVERLGGVLEISYSAQGVTCGALLGLFSLGIFFPWANAKGALWGSICSLSLVSFIVFGAQNAIATGTMTHKKLPTSVAGCPFNVTTTNIVPVELLEKQNEAFALFRLSYWYYGVVGAFTVISVGLIVSAFTGLQDPADTNINLIAPFLRSYVKKKSSIEEDIVELTEKDTLNTTAEEQNR